MPITSEITTVVSANFKEFQIIFTGDKWKYEPLLSEPKRLAICVVLNPPSMVNHRNTKAIRGDSIAKSIKIIPKTNILSFHLVACRVVASLGLRSMRTMDCSWNLA